MYNFIPLIIIRHIECHSVLQDGIGELISWDINRFSGNVVKSLIDSSFTSAAPQVSAKNNTRGGHLPTPMACSLPEIADRLWLSDPSPKAQKHIDHAL